MKKEYDNLLIDFYEFTMGQGYFDQKVHNDVVYFDMFFRRVPDKGSFVIANGVKKCAEYIKQLSFSKEDVEYLRSTGKFSEEYLKEIKNFKFTGDMWAVEDGTVVFPNEPIITIKAPLLQAQFIETQLLLILNRSSLITTKASRIVRAANGRAVMEFGSRRAHGDTAAIDGALDAYIAGAVGTACTATGLKYGVPVLGTMAHSFVQMFDTEYDAFRAYAKSYPDSCTLLVDTYNTLKSGIPNAIKTHNEVLKPMGKKLAGIRIDSGDLAYLTKMARQMLDEAGLTETKICVSNSLDETVISSLLLQGAPIDSFGVGENLITSKSTPVFGGVYKLVAVEKNGEIIPKIKVSDNEEKVTNPHFKKPYRLYDENGKLIADILYEHNEEAPKGTLLLNHPDKEWVKKEIKNFKCVNLHKKIFQNGKLVYNFPTIEETRMHVQQELSTLWEEALRLQNPHTYTVNLSDKLAKTKSDLLKKAISEYSK